MKTLAVPSIITLLTALIPIASNASTQVYDLADDWSTTANPNGQWSYHDNCGYLMVSEGDSWVTSSSCYYAFTYAFKQDDSSYILAVTGGPQSAGSFVWTAPQSGTIDVSGAADFYTLAGWGLGDWVLLHNGTPFSAGTAGLLSEGSGGAESLQHVPVAAGDRLALAPHGEYCYLSFTIAFTPSAADPLHASEELQAAVIAMNLENGIENSLDTKLDAALNALDDLNANNDAAACNSLDAFINAVEAQRGNQITGAQADQLIASAQEIQALLDCGN